LETHGIAVKEQSAFSLMVKTKLTAWTQMILRGGLFRGMTGLTLATANTLHVFLKHAKIRALTAK
jgi:hypothetical protein